MIEFQKLQQFSKDVNQIVNCMLGKLQFIQKERNQDIADKDQTLEVELLASAGKVQPVPDLDVTSTGKGKETAQKNDDQNRLHTLAKQLLPLALETGNADNREKTFRAAVNYLNFWLNEVEITLITGEVERYFTSVLMKSQ